jgi:hypothetical protein
MDLVEVGWGDVDWIGLAQDRDKWRALVNSVLNLHSVISHERIIFIITAVKPQISHIYCPSNNLSTKKSVNIKNSLFIIKNCPL